MFAQAFDVPGIVLALVLRVGDATVPGIKDVQTIQGGKSSQCWSQMLGQLKVPEEPTSEAVERFLHRCSFKRDLSTSVSPRYACDRLWSWFIGRRAETIPCVSTP